MGKTILVCGRIFDGRADALLGPAEILIEGDTIAEIAETAGRAAGVRVIDLGDHTASPGFIDTHVHLCVDGLDLARQFWKDFGKLMAESVAEGAARGLSQSIQRDLGARSLDDAAYKLGANIGHNLSKKAAPHVERAAEKIGKKIYR